MVTMSETKQNISMISIGALSRATGVPTETIRTWERRYGFPVPVRLDSGHRRYPLSAVEHLKLTKRALDQGHKPSSVVGADVDTLAALLSATVAQAETPAPMPPAPDAPGLEPEVLRWLEAVQKFNGDALGRSMRRDWNELGAFRFIEERLGPFLKAIGEWWATGRLHVMHEHFASEHLREFLAGRWRPMSDEAQGPAVICATLPQERHDLGLHMVALTLSMANLRVIFLGADMPTEEIAEAANIFKSPAVAISIASSSDTRHTQEQLGELRQSLPKGVSLLAGGTGAPRDMDGVVTLDGFDSLYQWASQMASSG